MNTARALFFIASLITPNLQAEEAFLPYQDQPSEKFISSLYEGNIVHSNFVLKSYSFKFSDVQMFDQVAKSSEILKEFVGARIAQICSKSHLSSCSEAKDRVQAAYVDRSKSGFISSYALALWFMKFDEDNWYSHSTIHKAIVPYFSSTGSHRREAELFLLKGVNPQQILVKAIAPDEIPVAIEYQGKVVTILVGDLFD